MYIYAYCFLVCLNNTNCFLFFLPCFLCLLYFNNVQEFACIIGTNLNMEDRLLFLMENIIKIDYNILVGAVLFLILSHVYFQHTSLAFIILSIFFFSIELKYQIVYFELLSFFKLNSKLLNGLFIIHPYCIYLFYALIFLILFSYTTKFKQWINNFNMFANSSYDYIKLIKQINKSISIGIWAISLGAWWAFQEINWAGWWSWDLIELINFILILLLVVVIHLPFYTIGNKYSAIIKLLKTFIIILVFLVLSRFNIINSLHSFVILNNFNQMSYLLIILYIFFSIFFYESFIKYSTTRFLLKKINFLILFLKIVIAFNVYKIFIELLFFIINFDSSLSYLYYYKNTHYFLFINLVCILFYNSFSLITFFFLNFFLISFTELLLLIFLIFLIFKTSNQFFKVHVFIVLFIVLIYFKFNFIDFSYKNWCYNFFYIIENYKCNITFIKQYILAYDNANFNYYSTKFLCFYISSFDLFTQLMSKKIIFMLSTFFLALNKMVVLNFQFIFITIFILQLTYGLYIYLNLLFFKFFSFFFKKKLVVDF